MDGVIWLAIAGGTILGAITGLLPGLHINTICAVYLVASPDGGLVGAAALAAAGTSHAFTSNLPATYLGLPGEETLASALPAHRMLLEGRGPEAIRLSAVAGLAGLVVGIAFVLPYKWLLLEPLNLLQWVDLHMTAVLATILLFLVGREAVISFRRAAWGALMLLLSGALGWIALGWNVQALVAVPATALTPLLSGLFGVPALLSSLNKPIVVPEQQPPPNGHVRLHGSMAAGVVASAATAILPGLSSSVAVALARAGRSTTDPRPILATQAAIASTHLVLSFAVLWFSLRARTGLAVAVAHLSPVPQWTMGAAPATTFVLLQACLAAGIIGVVITLGLGWWASNWVHRLPGRGLALVALTIVVSLVVVLSGWAGLVLMCIATVIGTLPAVAGVGRLHLTGALLVPVLAMRLGFTP